MPAWHGRHRGFPGICRPCDAGYYCPGGLEKIACPVDATSAPLSASIRACHCAENLRLLHGECQPCVGNFLDCGGQVTSLEIAMELEDLTDLDAVDAALFMGETTKIIIVREALDAAGISREPEIAPDGVQVRARYAIPLQKTEQYSFQVILPYLTQADLDAALSAHVLHDDGHAWLNVTGMLEVAFDVHTQGGFVAGNVRDAIRAKSRARLTPFCFTCRGLRLQKTRQPTHFGRGVERSTSDANVFHVKTHYDLSFGACAGARGRVAARCRCFCARTASTTRRCPRACRRTTLRLHRMSRSPLHGTRSSTTWSSTT